MDRYAFATRDVSNDFLTSNWIAAFGPIHEKVVKSTNFKFCVRAQAQDSFDHGRNSRFVFRRDSIGAIWSNPYQDLLCGNLSITDQSKQVFGLACSVIGQYSSQFLAIKHTANAHPELASFLFEHPPAELYRLVTLLLRKPVPYLVASS